MEVGKIKNMGGEDPEFQLALFRSRAVGTCLQVGARYKVGGQKEGILCKNL